MKHIGFVSHTLFSSINKLGYSKKDLLPQTKTVKEAKKTTKKTTKKKTTKKAKKDV